MSRRQPQGLVILGGGGHARSVADVATRLGTIVLAVVAPSGAPGWDVPVVADVTELDETTRAATFTVAIGSNAARVRELETIDRLGLAHATVVAVTATVGGVIGAGCQILEHAHVGPNAVLGRGVIVNTAAVVEHDVVVGDGVHLAPGARVLGGAVIEPGAMVGAGAVVLPSVRVGRGAIIGAGSVVVRDVPADCVVRGVPAQVH